MARKDTSYRIRDKKTNLWYGDKNVKVKDPKKKEYFENRQIWTLTDNPKKAYTPKTLVAVKDRMEYLIHYYGTSTKFESNLPSLCNELYDSNPDNLDPNGFEIVEYINIESPYNEESIITMDTLFRLKDTTSGKYFGESNGMNGGLNGYWQLQKTGGKQWKTLKGVQKSWQEMKDKYNGVYDYSVHGNMADFYAHDYKLKNEANINPNEFEIVIITPTEKIL